MRTPGERLKWALSDVGGLSLRRCDTLVGKTQGHLQAITTGTIKEPRASTLAKYATLGGLSLEWVLTGRGEAPTSETIQKGITAAQLPRKRASRKSPARRPGTRRSAEQIEHRAAS